MAKNKSVFLVEMGEGVIFDKNGIISIKGGSWRNPFGKNDDHKITHIPVSLKLLLFTENITECLGIAFQVKNSNDEVVSYGVYHSASEHGSDLHYGLDKFFGNLKGILKNNKGYTTDIYLHGGTDFKQFETEKGYITDPNKRFLKGIEDKTTFKQVSGTFEKGHNGHCLSVTHNSIVSLFKRHRQDDCHFLLHELEALKPNNKQEKVVNAAKEYLLKLDDNNKKISTNAKESIKLVINELNSFPSTSQNRLIYLMLNNHGFNIKGERCTLLQTKLNLHYNDIKSAYKIGAKETISSDIKHTKNKSKIKRKDKQSKQVDDILPSSYRQFKRERKELNEDNQPVKDEPKTSPKY